MLKMNKILRRDLLLAQAWWSYTTRKRCYVCHINNSSLTRLLPWRCLVIVCSYSSTAHSSILTSSLISQLMSLVCYFSRPLGAASSLIGSTPDNIASRSPSVWSLAVGDLSSRLHHWLNCSFVLQDNARVGDKFMNEIQPIAARVPYMTCPGNHDTA